MRRAGRVATGIDRVEIAYLSHLLEDAIPVYGLVRTAFGYLLLDSSGLKDLRARLVGARLWGAADLLSRLPRGRTDVQRRAEADARRLAFARATPRRLARLLKAHLPAGTAYLNVGHSNLTDRVMGAVRTIPNARISVLVHDVIPLDYPQFQRAGTVLLFEAKMRRVGECADLVIYNSADTKERSERWFSDWGRVPQGVTAHLGVDVVPAKGATPPQPYFVTVGTIEPRKNHAFLLDLWDEIGADAPGLYICGRRGWGNKDVFARLDALPPDSAVREMGGLSDAEISALVSGASGALYPSFAEGFGLPVAEALALGTPVLCSKLTTFEEIAGENAVYAEVNDRYLWINKIKKWAENTPGAEKVMYDPSNWTDHFKTVLRLT